MRKSEIEKRLAEIKTILSGTEACDVSALETEVRALNVRLLLQESWQDKEIQFLKLEDQQLQ
jgi:hypothetical protein